jgi:DNA-binding SARP family transcriptional activator
MSMMNETTDTRREFRLELFGGPRLCRGTTPVRLSPQELALVALVAAAGRNGMNRDEILDHLWKSGSQTTLRPRLAQILHMARQKLGWAEAMIDADRSLILSSDLFSTDLQDYEAALDSGRFEEAISLLSLGFLPNLRAAETHSMIQWLEDRHVQLRDQARRELGRALQQANHQADFPRQVELCSLQLQLDPHDEVTLRRLLRAYVALGKPSLAEDRYIAFSTFQQIVHGGLGSRGRDPGRDSLGKTDIRRSPTRATLRRSAIHDRSSDL